MSIEAMKQAVEAFEHIKKYVTDDGAMPENWDAYHEKEYYALEALRQAIEQAEKQEPVAWMVLTQDDKKLMLYGEEKPPIFNTPVKLIPLYAAPPKSDNELDAIDKSIHEEIERLKTEIKRLKELAEYRLKLLMKMPEQADQEPVAYKYTDKTNPLIFYFTTHKDSLPNPDVIETALYTAPPKRKWIGLTDVEVGKYSDRLNGSDIAREVEAKLKERNT
jgi:hypothetical protein